MNDLVKRLRGRRVSASLRNDRSGTLEMREIQDPLAVEAADCIEELKRDLAAERERADRNQKDAERLDWIEKRLFDKHWNGVIDSGSKTHWRIGEGYRHVMREMIGHTFRTAIDAAIDAARGK